MTTNSHLFVERYQAAQDEDKDTLQTVSVAHGGSGHRRLQRNSHSSPIGQLPQEILAEIFLLAIPKDSPVLWNALNWTRNSPNNVAAVCHFWRNVALSHNQLWSTFRFTEDSSKSDTFPWRLLRLFLRRSDKAPLDLKLILSRYTHANYSTIISIFHRYRDRCRHIDVSWESSGPMKIKNVLEFPDMPILKTLQLGLAGEKWPVRIDLSRFHSLQKLEIYGLSLLETNRLTIPTMTSAALHYLSPYACLLFLKVATSLSSFRTTLGRTDQRLVEGTKLQYVCNTALTSFTLRWKRSSSVRSVLAPLHLPNLKQLHTHMCADMITDRPAAVGGSLGIASLLSRSHALIENLNIHGCSVNEIIECLELSPNLERLEAEFYSATTIGEDLAYEDPWSYINNPRLEFVWLDVEKPSDLQHVLKRLHLPRLRNLTVRTGTAERYGSALGVAALLSRSRSPLKYLRLNTCAPDEILECLKASPNLETLHVDFTRKFTTEKGPTHQAENPYVCGSSLTSCSLWSRKVADLRYFLRPLHFPSLETLAIWRPAMWDDTGIRIGASALLSRSKISIKRLDLQNFSVDEIIECLELSPELEVLKLEIKYDDVRNIGRLIDRLTLTSNNWLCPKLTAINFRGYSDMIKLVEDFVAMINSRWYPFKGPRNLTKVNIYECGIRNLPTLNPCREEGLMICCLCAWSDGCKYSESCEYSDSDWYSDSSEYSGLSKDSDSSDAGDDGP